MTQSQTRADDTLRPPTTEFADAVDRGDVVEYEYADDGDTVTGEGVVCKAPKNKIVVLLPEARRRGALRVFKTDHYGTTTGPVHTNNREGNARSTPSVGTHGRLRRTGDTVSVSYKQMSGYRVDDD